MKVASKIILGALLVLAGVVLLIAGLGLCLWLMIPLAFPALTAWTYGNAFALAWIIVLVGLPWLVRD